MSSSNTFIPMRNSLFVLVLLVFGSFLAACNPKTTEAPIKLPAKEFGKLVNIGKMPFARTNHIAVKLKDGRVLILGGQIRDKESKYLGETKKVQIFDPKTNKFSIAGEMDFDPKYFELNAILLKDGNILLLGSYRHSAYGNVFIECKTRLYNPKTQKFYPGPILNKPRSYPALIALDDGTAMVFGGEVKENIPERSFEIYHPDTNSFELKDLQLSFPKFQRLFTPISDPFTNFGNKIYFSGLPASSEDIYAKIPVFEATNNFNIIKSLGTLSYLQSSNKIIFTNNNRLVVGGAHRTGPHPIDFKINALEVLNTTTGKSLGIAKFDNITRLFYTLTPFGDRYVLLVGGRRIKENSSLDNAQVCDTIQLQCYQPMHMPSPRENHTATLLDDGSILILGGINKALPQKVDKDYLTINGHHYDRVRNQDEIVSDVLRFYPTQK